jgi:uncharacterized membrane protein YdjX (TVP38/TMEM64 family)
MRGQHLITGLTLILTAIGIVFLLFWFPPHEKEITDFTLKNPLLAPLIIIALRIIGTVVPPLPGGILAYAMIPVLGWFWAYIYSMIGLTIGCTLAFFIARKFREPVVSKFVPLQQLHAWEKQLTHKKQFFAFLLIRLTTGPIVDFISYVAGLSRISFGKFFLATLIAEIPVIIPFFLGGTAYGAFEKQNPYVGLGMLLSLGVAFYFLKNHEFFKKK